jgi:CHASE2 domain-containing sensor protein
MSEQTGETVSTSNRWTPLTAGIALAIAVATGLMIMSQLGFKPEGPDAWTYDWRTYFFSSKARTQRNDIAVVYIGEQSVADYDYISPVDRRLMARVIQALNKAKVKAIGLDFIYDRKADGEKTRELLDAIRNSNVPVVMGAFDKRSKAFGPEAFNYQDDFIRKAGPKLQVGHVYFSSDVETVKISDQVARYLVGPSDEPPQRRALAALLADVIKETKEPATNYIAWQLPPDNASDLYATFTVPRHEPNARLDDIIPPKWYKLLENKVVLVGGDFLDRDRHLTPLSIMDGRKIAGVNIQAQMLAQRIDGRAVYNMPKYVEFPLLAVVCFLGFLISQQYQSKKLDFVLYACGIAVFVVAGIALFATLSTILPTTLLLFAWTAGVTGAHYSKDVLHKIKVAVGDRRKILKLNLTRTNP